MFGKRKGLNDKTPKWFRDFYYDHFLPLKIRQDVMITIGIAILIGLGLCVINNVFG